MGQFNLANTRLFWPSWNQAIPFSLFAGNVCGERGVAELNSCRFTFDPDMAEFVDITNNHRMPVNTAKLILTTTGKTVNYTNFYILGDKVQINNHISGGYSITMEKVNELAFSGYSYDPAEDE